MLLRTPVLLCFPSLVHHIISRKEAGASFDDALTISLLEFRAKWKQGRQPTATKISTLRARKETLHDGTTECLHEHSLRQPAVYRKPRKP